MPAWATVVITLGASAIAVLGTLGATILQQRFARREREAAEALEWVKSGAAVLGPIQSLLTDADPRRVAMNLSDDSEARMTQLRRDRWEGDLRDRLAVLATAHPFGGVRAKASDLSVALHNSLTATSWLIRDMRHANDRSELAEARAEHDKARELADELSFLLRRFAGQQRGNKRGRASPRRRIQALARKARSGAKTSA